MTEAVDYVVVRAGSAGCVVAARLSEDLTRTVLLLEAGGWDHSINIQMRAATYLKAIGNPRFEWRFTSEADPTRAGRRDAMPRGWSLGGSSSINSMIYLRGQKEDFDARESIGNRDWGYESVLPYFKKAEDNENGADHVHGVGGPLAVSNLRVRHPISEAFIESTTNLGVPRRDDMNPPQQEGIGSSQATQRRGRSCSSASAYLWPTKKRKNLESLTNARVRKIVIQEVRARGVEFKRKDPQFGLTYFVTTKALTPLSWARRAYGGILRQKPILRYVVGDLNPGPEVQSDAEWRRYVHESAIGFHCTAGRRKMGNDEMVVVEDRLRVRGIYVLYVADASINPSLFNTKLNANCIMIGERCANFVKADARSSSIGTWT